MPKYDFIVVGAGIGGLAAAALASVRNKKTLVLEQADAAGGALASFTGNGHLFYPGPRLSYGFEPGGTLHLLHESLGIPHTAELKTPCYQVALPGRRITVSADQTETLEELKREYPREFDRIRTFYSDLRRQASQYGRSRALNFLSRRLSAGSFLRTGRLSREFAAFLDLQASYFFGRPAGHLSRFQLVTLCGTPPMTLPGGFTKLAERILEVLLKNGGEIRYNVPFSGISLRPGGLAVPGGEFQADTVLINPVQEVQRRVLGIGVREEVIPESMLREVLAAFDYGRSDGFFTISVGSREGNTMQRRHVPASPSSRLRTLTVSFPISDSRQQEERMGDIASLVPFLTDFLQFAQEFEPSPRVFSLQKGTVLKNVRAVADPSLFKRLSTKGVSVLFDGVGTPVQSIAAAQRFVARMQ